MRRTFPLLAALLLTLTFLPSPAAGVSTDPIVVRTIAIDPTRPAAGAGYSIFTSCGNDLDPLPCIYIPAGGWARYSFTVDGYGTNGVDYLTGLVRGFTITSHAGCTARIVGPGMDQTAGFCPFDDDNLAEGIWDRGYPEGAYTIEIRCNGGAGCGSIELSELYFRLTYRELVLDAYESEQEHFPPPGQLPGAPSFRACIELDVMGSNWYRSITYAVDWGDGSDTTGSVVMGYGWEWFASWDGELCHQYEFAWSTYQACVVVTDSLARSLDRCLTINGGLDPDQFLNDGVAYATGSVA